MFTGILCRPARSRISRAAWAPLIPEAIPCRIYLLYVPVRRIWAYIPRSSPGIKNNQKIGSIGIITVFLLSSAQSSPQYDYRRDARVQMGPDYKTRRFFQMQFSRYFPGSELPNRMGGFFFPSSGPQILMLSTLPVSSKEPNPM